MQNITQRCKERNRNYVENETQKMPQGSAKKCNQKTQTRNNEDRKSVDVVEKKQCKIRKPRKLRK